MSAAAQVGARELTLRRRLRGSLVARGALGTWSGRTGIILAGLIVAVALLGPLIAPQDPDAIVGLPFAAPSADAWLGTDLLGRDALSRFLTGGATLVAVVFGATLAGYIVGTAVGMLLGLRRGVIDLAGIGVVDVLIAFPPIIFVLMLVAGAGSGVLIVSAAIAIVHAPRVARVVRAATLDIVTLEYVEAAVARGEGTSRILRRDLLPNLWPPILADFGLRLTGSVILFSSLSYLGLGAAPPASDWGLMISENRAGILQQPWVIVVPALAIALFAIGANLVSDAVARAAGRSAAGRDG